VLEFIRCSSTTAAMWLQRRTPTSCAKLANANTFDRYQVALRIIWTTYSHHSRSAVAEAKENLLKFFSEQDVTVTENGKSGKIEGVKLDAEVQARRNRRPKRRARLTGGGLKPVQWMRSSNCNCTA